MPALHKLSTVKIKSAPPGKYSDGGGLWLHKREDGGAQWVLRVTVHGRRREMGLGRLDDVSVKEARALAAKWQAVARDDKDPIKERERERREAAKPLNTLSNVAADAFESRKAELKGDGKAGRWFTPLELHVLPKLGKIPVEEIDQQDIKNTLAPIWHTKRYSGRREGWTCQPALRRHLPPTSMMRIQSVSSSQTRSCKRLEPSLVLRTCTCASPNGVSGRG